MSDKVYGIEIFTEQTNAWNEDIKPILLKDYLNYYEMNDKAVISIHNDITNNRLFCDRVDYLNVDRKTGYMSPLSLCEIAYFLEPDDLYIRLNEEVENKIIQYYADYGAKRYEE
ncbi:hypothetical protein NZ45_00880 [Clostridium botulinum]|uniref:Uncharacterized protein n=1 Tax=Clostridium botulinum TaxID=1491 RepID=A0ABD7CF78_CLOBO|nr:hypothetical protein [Clostridium botulinum]KGO15591.1 hypothetical protein NZ45_00880 [Clostridium botulinum]QRI51990.1 hypothetical protein JQS73_11035 [Clostridium botulinum]